MADDITFTVVIYRDSSFFNELKRSVVGKSIQYGMTLSHSKGDSSLATIKAKLSKITSL